MVGGYAAKRFDDFRETVRCHLMAATKRDHRPFVGEKADFADTAPVVAVFEARRIDRLIEFERTRQLVAQKPLEVVVVDIAVDGVNHLAVHAKPVMAALLPEWAGRSAGVVIELCRIRLEAPDGVIDKPNGLGRLMARRMLISPVITPF